jgi:hypothetical protein
MKIMLKEYLTAEIYYRLMPENLLSVAATMITSEAMEFNITNVSFSSGDLKGRRALLSDKTSSNILYTQNTITRANGMLNQID